MKSNRLLRSFLIFAPMAGLFHVVLSVCLLWMRIESRPAYVIGDVAIVVLALCGCFIFYKKFNTDQEGFHGVAPEAESGIQSDIRASDRRNRLTHAAIWASLALCVFALWSVRLSYTGPAYDGVVVSEIKDAKISLPVFSDEWLYAGFARKAAQLHALPVFYPFADQQNTAQDNPASQAAVQKVDNLLVPYVSAFAGLMISTGIDAVDANYIYVFAFQLVFVLVAYAFLRSLQISKFASIVGVVLVLCLPESNLFPGIWIMLPAYIGLIWLLVGLILIHHADERKSNMMTVGIYANFAFASILYPPYLILILIGLLARNLSYPKKIIAYSLIMLVAGLLAAKIAGFDMRFDLQGIGNIAERAWGLTVRDKVGSATASIWAFIPVVFFLASIVGLWLALWKKELGLFQKKLLLFGSLLLGLLVSCVYLFDKEIILSHQRTVFLLWMLMAAMICYFIDSAIARIDAKSKKAAMIVVILAFLSLAWISVSGMYQRLPAWKGVTAHVDVLADIIPSRPIMLSMLPDGFESLVHDKKGRFLADPYMSLAIGATTHLVPISATPSFITVVGPKMSDFQKLTSCESKYDFAIEHSISYAIMHDSTDSLRDCPGFVRGISLGDAYTLYDFVRK